jgi:hypothetical protein
MFKIYNIKFKLQIKSIFEVVTSKSKKGAMGIEFIHAIKILYYGGFI